MSSISLLAKWMPSSNTSSKITVSNAQTIIKYLGIKESQYRKLLSTLRSRLKVVEVSMSAQDWQNINYGGVSSNAMTKYRKAFSKHDPEGFVAYLESVKKGEAKIHSATLFPYDILEKYGYSGYNSYGMNNKLDAVLEEQWKALPNYIDGENDILIMCDTSGSMRGRPVCTSVGLSIYFAERNKGVWHNKFMTFSNRPMVEIKGNSLLEKLKSFIREDANTNVEAGFDLILNTAMMNHLTNDDMPKALVIISDMQFDQASQSQWNKTHFDMMTKKFNNAGYDMPNVIFWNVNSMMDTYQVDSTQRGVQLVSGQSQSTFKAVIDNIGTTPYEAMVKVLNGEVYAKIVI